MKNLPLLSGILLFLLIVFKTDAQAESKMALSSHQLITGLGTLWGIHFISDQELLVTERGGLVKRVNINTGEIKIIPGVPKVHVAGQGGLLDVAQPEGSKITDWFYFSYSKAVRGGSVLELARARLTSKGLQDWQILFESNLISSRSKHYGGRIAFDGKGHLFLTHGDRGIRESAQNLGDHGGSLLRLYLDGSVPKDNPFVNTSGARPEIWSYGHRNQQGVVVDTATGHIWTIEHGPRGGDELNLIKAGKNYGWPVTSHGKEYALPVMVGESKFKEGIEPPRKVYIPSIAPGSLLLYKGERYPQWQGSLLTGALRGAHLNQIVLDDAGEVIGEKRYFENTGERIRDVELSPNGELFYSTDSGKIFSVRVE